MELQKLFEAKDKVEAKLRKLLTPEFIARHHEKVLDGFFTHLNEGQMVYLYDDLIHEDIHEEVDFNFEILAKWLEKNSATGVKYEVNKNMKRLSGFLDNGQIYVTHTEGVYRIEYESMYRGVRWKKKDVKKATDVKATLETFIAHDAKQVPK